VDSSTFLTQHKCMRLSANEYAIETPIVLLILILVIAPLIFFAIRHERKDRAETQAQAKRESTYQAALHTYGQVIKPGMKRKEVEEYLRSNKIEFVQLSLDDLTKIGEDAPSWFCGSSGVYVKFQFIGVKPPEPRLKANDEDTLDELKIFHWADNCL
jgi:hypothetical protein